MENKKVIMDGGDAGKRLDVVLTEKLPEISRGRIKSLLGEGFILVGGEKKKAGYKVKAGDTVSVTVPPDVTADILPEAMDLDIVYEDEDVMVINKPQGMVVHPGPGNTGGTLVNGLMAYTDSLSTINGVMRPGIVHRIDKDTSGLLMVAKNDHAHGFLSDQLAAHSIKREYIGLSDGLIENNLGKIDMPIGRHPSDRIKMAVVKDNSKDAVTHFEVLERLGSGYTLVKFNLETGRTHQIRVHMAAIGHPLVGDPLYGKKIKTDLPTQGQMLHARVLGFVHPCTGEMMVFEAPLPDYFSETLDQLK